MTGSAVPVRCRVLLIDDDPGFRALLRERLEATGVFDVLGEAADGAEGLALVGALRPEAVVVDFSMPRMNGLETAYAIEKRWPEVVVVMVTGSDFDLEAELLAAAHTAALLSKQRFDADDLVRVLLDARPAS